MQHCRAITVVMPMAWTDVPDQLPGANTLTGDVVFALVG